MTTYGDVSEQLLRAYEPREEWLAHDSDIHGVGHMTRVFILQELICDGLEQLDIPVDREVIRYAAMAHDVGRVDDGLDLEHGKRSTEWIASNLAKRMSPEMLDAVTYCVYWHVPPDSEAPVMSTELQVLKDADGLDRVRLGDLDPSYLRTEPARELIDVARRLHKESMPNDNFEAVVESAESLNLVRA